MGAHLSPNANNLKLLISDKAIHSKVCEIGKLLDKEYKGRELVIVMIMKGAICLVADLIRHLTIPTRIEFIQSSSYGHHGTQRGPLSIFGVEQLNINQKDVLLIDDIFDSGVTLSNVAARLQEQKPASIKSLVLLSKKVPRAVDYIPDYSLFEIENHFIVGYGMDCKEYYRGLPSIYVLEKK